MNAQLGAEKFDKFHWLYAKKIAKPGDIISLDELSRQHLKSLRLRAGDQIVVTDGKGNTAHAELLLIAKKEATARVISSDYRKPLFPEVVLAVAFTKNPNRNDLILEKVSEFGVSRIIPLETTRSLRSHLKLERSQRILISAMLQSQQAYLPQLEDTTTLQELLSTPRQHLIAHCYEQDAPKINILDIKLSDEKPVCLLIGPEGDFTESEVLDILRHDAVSINLGPNRLRTETAAILGIGALYLKKIN